jgi:DNA-binding transcriptional LysR family regulator
LSLTESGRGFYEQGSRILADLEEVEAAIQQQHGELRGRLRFAMPLSFGVRHMCGPIATFRKQHPKVSFELDLNDRRVDLVEDNFDLALRIGHLRDSSLIARRLFDVRSAVCASPHYWNINGKPNVPEDLLDHECLVYSNLADPDKWQFKGPDGRHGTIKVTSSATRPRTEWASLSSQPLSSRRRFGAVSSYRF